MDHHLFEERKREHLRLALSPDHQATGLTGLESLALVHDSLPELDLDAVTLSSKRLGQTATKPFFVAGMTAGHADAVAINSRLAAACAARGWAFGVGSQRRELESFGQSGAGVDRWAQVRENNPSLCLIANLGASQLVTASIAQIQSFVSAMGAQAIAIHLNALQEVIQPEGTPRFAGVMDRVRALREEIGVPVILKETGCGFSRPALKKAASLRVAAVDVSGLGGTHWGRIEGARAAERGDARGQRLSRLAVTFSEWGHSTVDSVIAAAEILPACTEVWASGGVRTGLDAAKLIALGAHQVGFARPALEAAIESEESLSNWMDQIEFELKTALFCTGAGSVDRLQGNRSLWIQKRSSN